MEGGEASVDMKKMVCRWWLTRKAVWAATVRHNTARGGGLWRSDLVPRV
jgi:hypothetical protein